MSQFLNQVVFPEYISRGSLGGPDLPAEISKLASGFEQRRINWSAPLRLYDVGYNVRTLDEMSEVLDLYHVCYGRLYGFRYKDPIDFKTCKPSQIPAASDQQIGVGDGAETTFQLTKTYTYPGAPNFTRIITKPYDTVLIALDDVPTAGGWTLDFATGILTFDVAPVDTAVITWGGVFHVPVRFDTKLDQVEAQGAFSNLSSIFLTELKLL